MKEQLINFETAKLAKEKGFDWNVDAGFCENESNFICGENSSFFPTEFRRPSQSRLQKWLREIHNKNIVIISANKSGKESGFIFSIGSIQIQNFEWQIYKIYEDALEEALQKSLKSII